MSCKAIVPKTAVIVFVARIKVIAMKLVKFLIAKSLKLGHRYLISLFLLSACFFLHAESFQQTIIAIEKVFWRMTGRIKPNC